jgi:phage terminase large subunit-like protein
MYDAFKANLVIAEKNFGGEMVEHTLRTVGGSRERGHSRGKRECAYERKARRGNTSFQGNSSLLKICLG